MFVIAGKCCSVPTWVSISKKALNETRTPLFICTGGCPKAGDTQEFGALWGRGCWEGGTRDSIWVTAFEPPKPH